MASPSASQPHFAAGAAVPLPALVARATRALVILAATGVALLGAPMGASLAHASGSAAPHPGARYVGMPFSGDPFTLAVAPNGRTASFVGRFAYSDPGCPSEPSGTEYLTPANAPKVTIDRHYGFFGARTTGLQRDVITGTFHGSTASAEFKQSIRCHGDKPITFRFTMRVKRAA